MIKPSSPVADAGVALVPLAVGLAAAAVTGVLALGTVGFPLLIHQPYRGDWVPFANLAAALGFAIFNQVSMGMQLSVVCAEDVPHLAKRDVSAETAGTFSRDYRVAQQLAACAEWPIAAVPPRFAEPVEAANPVLLISGAADPATPPRFGAAAASHLRNSRHLVVANAGYVPSNDCISRLVASFFGAGSVAQLDDGCVGDDRRPPFLTELPN
jgi:pimeloyl-ACP methyl ester carboxylesterase